MSRIRIVKGKIYEKVGGDLKYYSEADITEKASQIYAEQSAKEISHSGDPGKPSASEIKAKCLVHFRTKNGWQGEDYGFDWMRLGESANFGDTDYIDIVAKQYTDNTFTTLETDINTYSGSFKTSPVSYSKLKFIYGSYNISWRKKADGTPENYFCSWLSIYPSQIKDAKTGKLQPSHFKNTKALLSLIVEVEEEPETLKFKENKYFKISPMEITPKTKGQHNLADYVTIECLEEFSTDQSIEVYATKKNKDGKEISDLAGKLKVWANQFAKRKKAKVLLIEIKTPIISKSSNTGSSVGQKELFEKYLRQALIETEVEIQSIDLSSDVNFQTGGKYVNGTSVVAFYKSTSNTPKGFVSLEDYVYAKLKAELKKNKEPETKYDNYYKAIYLGEPGGAVDAAGKVNRLNGYSSGKFVVLFPSKNDQTSAHEFLHSFSLPHSFTNSEADANALFTYEYAKTENLMDYSHRISQTRYNLWKWQWEKANTNANKLL